MSTSNPTIEEYAEEVRDGLNQFLVDDGLEIRLSCIVSDTDNHTRITLSLTPTGESPSSVEYSSPDIEYTVEDAGEEIKFACQDSQHIHISSTADDWSMFDVTEHTGEAISCAIESDV